jgi:hypothetical protein
MIIAYALLAAVLVVGGFLYLNRPQLVTVDEGISKGFPVSGFAHDELESLLHKYVDSSGNVDYERWHRNEADRAQLEQYLAAVSRYSPDNAPERFPKRSDALAYWLYGYNAYVIHSVLGHWPLESVTDVRAPIEAVTGLGFFYRQRFLFGEEPYSLYAVEHDKILAAFKDPRIHFVLNCASDSCPVLRPELPTGDELEAMLVSSTADFVNDHRNVSVDHDKSQIVLSTIFKWYRNDFLNDLRRRSLPIDRGVVEFIADAGSTELQKELNGAAGYEVIFADYDWSLNSVENSAH